MTNEQRAHQNNIARNTVMPAIMKAVDSVSDYNRGRITFDDVVDAVSIYVDQETQPALFDAAKRIVESERCITLEVK